MHIHSKGDNFIVQVGHTKMEQDRIVENIFAAVDKLQTEFPGGLDNMRALHVKTPTTTSVPIYYTLSKLGFTLLSPFVSCLLPYNVFLSEHNKEVKVPVVLSKRPKAFKEHKGELTTKNEFDVLVTPYGKVSSSKNVKQ